MVESAQGHGVKRRVTEDSALRAELLGVLRGRLHVFDRSVRLGAPCDRVREAKRQIRAVERGKPVTVDAFTFRAALARVDLHDENVVVAEFSGMRFTVAPDGTYEPA